MKHLIKTILIFTIFTNGLIAQNTFDKIIKKNYEILDVTISKISDKEVEFMYPNETLKNQLELSSVAKIIFKSGRTQEFFNEQNLISEKPAVIDEIQSSAYAKKPMKKNTIAVLPIPFVNIVTLASSSEMSKFAQNDVYNKLIERSRNILPLTIQDLRETNSLLRNAGIDYSNIDEILIKDLQEILGVDHIVASKVSYTLSVEVTSSGHNSTTIKQKNVNRTNIDDFSSSSTYEDKSFDYTVYFDIYKNLDKIYTRSRKPFFKEQIAWMDSMQYLLKRSPIYSK